MLKMTAAVHEGRRLAYAVLNTSVEWHNVGTVSYVISRLRQSTKPENKALAAAVELRLAEHFEKCATYTEHTH